MPVKTNILLVKTKCSNQLIKPLHIAPTAHQFRNAQRCVCTLMFLFWITCYQGICCQFDDFDNQPVIGLCHIISVLLGDFYLCERFVYYYDSSDTPFKLDLFK